METFVKRFIEQSDGYLLLSEAAHNLKNIRLLTPIPETNLLWGIVGNDPPFTRNHMNIKHINLYPQGHQRHTGSPIGDGDPFIHRRLPGMAHCFNAELGIVIGKKCRNIEPKDAMKYIAGYTVVCDTANNYYAMKYPGMEEGLVNPLSVMCYGWTYKNTDFSCAVGPYLVTKDEVGHPYDLNIYSRTNGILRDRANTCSMLVGVERTIAYYSSFATLHPGDIIHMGASGKDGLDMKPQFTVDGEQQILECEIERVGILRNPVIYDEAEPRDKTLHLPYMAKKLIREGKDSISPDAWDPTLTKNFIIVYGNYKDADKEEKIEIRKLPRYLWSTRTALGRNHSSITTPGNDSDMYIGAEIAFIVGNVVKWAEAGEAERSILGYVPMICIYDRHLSQEVVEPALPRERALAAIYARWAEGCNIIPDSVTPMEEKRVKSLEMKLYIDDEPVLVQNSENYTFSGKQIVEMITYGSTLLPGDVITFGRVGAQVCIPAEKRTREHKVRLAVEGMPEVACIVR